MLHVQVKFADSHMSIYVFLHQNSQDGQQDWYNRIKEVPEIFSNVNPFYSDLHVHILHVGIITWLAMSMVRHTSLPNVHNWKGALTRQKCAHEYWVVKSKPILKFTKVFLKITSALETGSKRCRSFISCQDTKHWRSMNHLTQCKTLLLSKDP